MTRLATCALAALLLTFTPRMAQAAPLPPTNVTATAASLSEIDLAWTVSPGATGFKVFSSTTSGGPYSLIATVRFCTYWNTGLTGGATYYYVVQATDATGASGNSLEVNATTATQPPLPVPTGLATSTFSNTRIDLSWDAAVGATGYRLMRSAASTGPYVQVAATATTTFSNIKLLANATYYYEVESTNGSRVSAPSAFIIATTITPVAPTNMTATTISGTQINLAWTASTAATGYNVLRSTTSGGPYAVIGSPAGTSYSDTTGLASGVTYYYVVQATNGNLVSGASVEATATAP